MPNTYAVSGTNCAFFGSAGPKRKTALGGEFGWGGTSVKQ